MKRTLPFLILIVAWNCSVPREQKSTDADTTAQVLDEVDLSSSEETEAEETERLTTERAEQDELSFSELDAYDGSYVLQTESEGADGKLELHYKGEKVFKFSLDLKVPDVCEGNISGEVLMDRTQHGFFAYDGCFLHFNFMGNWGDSGFIVEIEQPEPCNLMKGDCIFTGKYITGTVAN